MGSLPIPKGTADKIITILGGIAVILGIGVQVFTNTGDAGIASAISGVAMIVKGMEEFLGGKSSAAVQDVLAGAEQIKASEPQAKADVKAVEANPIPVAVAVVEEVAKEEDKSKSS